ncbi:MAG TPA: hypothetical protein VIX91_07960 [Candidatus Acidoferrum sp.]
MRTLLASILGMLLGANGLWMLAGPFHWYAHIPGVTEAGPANAHLIRDVGCAFLVPALALLWFAVSQMRAWPAVLAGAAFPFLHATVHVWDTIAGREHALRLLAEIPTVILPALVTLWLGWPPRKRREKE